MADTYVEDCEDCEYCGEETDCILIDGKWICQECSQKKSVMGCAEFEESCRNNNIK